MIMNKYFDIYWENPLKTYKKVKKFFLPLKPKFQLSFHKGNCAKILELNSFDVMWKDKYDTPRHELSPYITLVLFNFIHLRVNFVADSDSLSEMVYWEAVLYWLYYGKTLQDSVKEASGWSDLNKETGKFEEISFTILQEPWQTDYNNKLLNFLYEDRTR